MSKAKQNIEPQQIHGDRVGGDKTTVGNITNAKGVAVGRGSTVVINENPQKPLMILLGGLVLVVILIAVVLLIREINIESKPLKLVNISSQIDVFTDNDLLRDVVVQDEFVWFATNRGLLVHNEEERQNTWILEGQNVTSIAEGYGQIWFGTDNGYLGRVASFDKGIEDIPSQQSKITAIFVNESGQAWVADTDQGIWLYESDGSILDSSIPLPDSETVLDLAVLTSSEQMIIWALTFPGIYRWKDGRWDILDAADGIPSEFEFYKVIVDSFGGSWFAHSEGVVYVKFHEKSLSRSSIFSMSCGSTESKLPSGPVDDMVLDMDWLWLVTPNGIARKSIVEEDSNVCANWQTYPTETENKWPSEATWRIGVRNSSCNSWLMASSESRVYRLSFEC